MALASKNNMKISSSIISPLAMLTPFFCVSCKDAQPPSKATYTITCEPKIKTVANEISLTPNIEWQCSVSDRMSYEATVLYNQQDSDTWLKGVTLEGGLSELSNNKSSASIKVADGVVGHSIMVLIKVIDEGKVIERRWFTSGETK